MPAETKSPLIELEDVAGGRTGRIEEIRERLFQIENRLAGDISRAQPQGEDSQDGHGGALGALLDCAERDHGLLGEIETILNRLETIVGVTSPQQVGAPIQGPSPQTGDLPGGLQQTQGD